MPRLVAAQPTYRLHKKSGQAIVTLNDHEYLLGLHGTEASRREYDRPILEWLARGLRPARSVAITVVELCAQFLGFADALIVTIDRPTVATAGFKATIKYLRLWHGREQAATFSSLGLSASSPNLAMARLGTAMWQRLR